MTEAPPATTVLAFSPAESSWNGLRRLLLGELDQAIERLADTAQGADLVVHETRKATKRLRALLRLARRPLRRSFRKLNKQLRNVSRSLAPCREASAALEALDQLAARANEAERERLLWARGTLLLSGPRLIVVRALLVDARSELSRIRRSIETWPELESGFELLGRGYRHSYRRARRALPLAAQQGTLEAFHELRKAVKVHQHQLAYFEPLAGAWLAPRRVEIAALSEALGEHHDLGLLALDLKSRGFEELAASAIGRSAELERAILEAAEHLFQERAREHMLLLANDYARAAE